MSIKETQEIKVTQPNPNLARRSIVNAARWGLSIATLSTCLSRQMLRQSVLLDPTSAKVYRVFETYILLINIRRVLKHLISPEVQPVHERLPWSSVYSRNKLQIWIEGSNLVIVKVFFLTVKV